MAEPMTSALRFPVLSEMNVREWFAVYCSELGYSIIVSQSACPDYVIEDRDGRQIRAEAEYESGNFLAHHHNIADCDMVICWQHNIPLPLPVLELRSRQSFDAGAPVPPDMARQEYIKEARQNKKTDADRLKAAAAKCKLQYDTFMQAMVEDITAQRAYQDGMYKPRLHLLQESRRLTSALNRAGAKIEQLHPYDLAQIVSVVVQPGRE